MRYSLAGTRVEKLWTNEAEEDDEPTLVRAPRARSREVPAAVSLHEPCGLFAFIVGAGPTGRTSRSTKH